MNLRKLAKDKPCMVRIAGVCNHDPATTVLAHFRMAGLSGIGMKSPDFIAAFACNNCHDAIDGRRYGLSRADMRLCHAEGVFRTQAYLIEHGIITVKGAKT